MHTFARAAFFLAAFASSGFCLALTPSIKTVVETPLRPIITGETNLPDGTELMLTISRPQSNFQAQSTVKVVGGKFRSERFSQKGNDFNPGKYKLEVSMGVSQVQAPEVRAVIGMRGEKMSGPLVRRGTLGPIVNYVTSFQAGGASSAQADKAARAKEKDDREAWLIKSCNDIVGLTSQNVGLAARQAEIKKCIREVKSKKST